MVNKCLEVKEALAFRLGGRFRGRGWPILKRLFCYSFDCTGPRISYRVL